MSVDPSHVARFVAPCLIESPAEVRGGSASMLPAVPLAHALRRPVGGSAQFGTPVARLANPEGARSTGGPRGALAVAPDAAEAPHSGMPLTRFVVPRGAPLEARLSAPLSIRSLQPPPQFGTRPARVRRPRLGRSLRTNVAP
eukprot:1123782-Pyramimonas_sp.AAC.1